MTNNTAKMKVSIAISQMHHVSAISIMENGNGEHQMLYYNNLYKYHTLNLSSIFYTTL